MKPEFMKDASQLALPAARSSELVTRQVGDELLVMDLRTMTAVTLNEPSARLWNSLDGVQTFGDLVEDEDADIVHLGLKELARADLLDGELPGPLAEPSLSRRALMRRLVAVGAAATILPTVSPLVVPANAQGTCSIVLPTCPTVINATTPNNLPNGCFCISNLNCASGICPTVSRICNNGPVGAFCSQIGNNVGASGACCPCQSNLDCAGGICPVSTQRCAF